MFLRRLKKALFTFGPEQTGASRARADKIRSKDR